MNQNESDEIILTQHFDLQCEASRAMVADSRRLVYATPELPFLDLFSIQSDVEHGEERPRSN